MNAACYCILLLALLFRKIAKMRIFHSESKNANILLYFAGIFVQKLNHRNNSSVKV